MDQLNTTENSIDHLEDFVNSIGTKTRQLCAKLDSSQLLKEKVFFEKIS